jgi:hypothetical protein
MVCADDTLSNLEDWVDVVVEGKEELNQFSPLTNAEASTKPEGVLNSTMNMPDDASLSIALRQKRQQEAQLAFLREHGLIKEYTVKEEHAVEVCAESLDQDSCQAEAIQAQESISEAQDMYTQAMNAARKVGIAAAGGTLVAVGAILTPLPTPGGILLAGAGLGVLSTEFECAKKVLDTGKTKLVDLIDSIPDEEEDTEEIVMKGSLDSEDSTTSESTSKTSISRSSSTVSQKNEVRASLEDRARRIGKSIRPFLTDEDAPRQAMEELNASTKRAVLAASGKINEFVNFMLVLDNEPGAVPPAASTLTSPFPGIMHGMVGISDTSDTLAATISELSNPKATAAHQESTEEATVLPASLINLSLTETEPVLDFTDANEESTTNGELAEKTPAA